MEYIGIDIGTSSICGVRYDRQSGKTVSITKPNASDIRTDEPWAFLQDASAIVETVRSLLEELLTDEVCGIGFSGQMHGMLYVDDEGQAVSPLYTWQDGSGGRTFRDGKTYAAWLSEASGHSLSTGYGLVTHFVHLQRGTVPAEARRLTTIMDYAGMRLCGRRVPLCEPSNAASLGFFDKRSLRFDVEALRKVGIDPSVLPEVVEVRTVVGEYTFGGRKIPVHVAIGDNQASFLGTVSNRETSVLVTIGTSSQLSVYSADYVEAEGLDTRPLPDGGYILVGAALCGGVSLAMLKDFFGTTVERFTGRRPTDEELYDRMFQSAVAGGEVPTVCTTFEGTRLEPSRRGSITDITLRNFLPETLVEGFLRGVCRELYDFWLALPEGLRAKRTELVGSGNALRKNARLRQTLSQMFGLPVTLTPDTEESALGAAVSC